MTKVAVILAGCGHKDGAEIREAVLSLLALDRFGAEVECFAPDIDQHDVINHLTGKETKETRNVLVEAARIARGKIRALSELKPEAFDALMLPGGFGAAKNWSDIAFKGKNGKVIEPMKKVIQAFHKQQKPIGAVCIAPAVLAAALNGKHPLVTIGKDQDGLIAGLGGQHQDAKTTEVAIDENNRLITAPAYMSDAKIADVATGIEKVVAELVVRAEVAQKQAA